MPNPYNDVELTEDDKQGIFEPVEAETPATPQTHEAESPEGASEVSESDDYDEEFNLEDYEVEIDGEVFDGADIIEWQENSVNNENWQAKNTQESQRLAKWSKFGEKLTSDDEFREYLKDYFYDDDDGLKSIGLDDKLQPIESMEEYVESNDNTYNEIEDMGARIDDMELERVVDELEEELDAIVEHNPNLFETEDDELNFLEFVEDNEMIDLEDAFKVWAYDAMQGELDHHRKLDGNKQRNQGRVVHNSEVGATEVSTPKNYKSIKDISYDDPDVRKYFDD